MSDDAVGIGAYRGGAAPSRATLVFAALKRKCELRAALEIESAKIAAALPSLNENEFAELRDMMAKEDAAADADVAALAAEAKRLAAEAAASRNVRPLAVPLSKAASRILAHEIERRIERGHCPDLSILAEQAIRVAYGSA